MRHNSVNPDFVYPEVYDDTPVQSSPFMEAGLLPPENKPSYKMVRGMMFSNISHKEVQNVLGMQSMYGTMASLIASVAVTLFTSQSIEEGQAAEVRLREGDCLALASQVAHGPAWFSAVSLTAAMFTVFLSLFLYVALSAANFPDEKCDKAFQTWLKWHFPLLVLEAICLFVATGFIWGAVYYLGAVKYTVNCNTFGLFGILGLIFIFLLCGYAFWVHFWKTVPAVKRCHDKEHH